METTSFLIEYHSDTPELTDQLKAKIERRIEKLSRGNTDLTSASIAVTTNSGDSQPREYRMRILLTSKLADVAVTEKGESLPTVVTEALGALERQVRERRDRRRESKKRQR